MGCRKPYSGEGRTTLKRIMGGKKGTRSRLSGPLAAERLRKVGLRLGDGVVELSRDVWENVRSTQ